MVEQRLPRDCRGWKLSPEQRDEMARRYVAGESTSGLAREYGVDRAAIRGNVTRRGIILTGKKFAALPYDRNAFSVLTPECAYWVGFLMADGCVTKDNRMVLKLSFKDHDHVEKFKAFLKAEHPVRVVGNLNSKKPEMKQSSLAIRSRQLCDDLRGFGLDQGVAIEGLCLNRDFWRGVIDGDGGIYTKRLPRVFLCGYPEIMAQFSNYVFSIIGRRPTIRKVKYSVIYSCHINGQYATALLSHLFYDGCTALSRKEKVAHRILAPSGPVGII